MIKLCVFADIHYIDIIPNWPVKRKLVEYADCLTDKLIEKINNEIKPNIVIFLGDFIQATNDKEQDKKNILHVWDKFSEIKCPYYTILGNHELKLVQSNKEILDLIGYKNATYSLDVEDYHLVFIGTDIYDEDKLYKTQYISNQDLEWLEEDLERNRNKKIVLFSHFGIAEDRNIKDNFWCYSEDGENLMLRNRDKLKKIIKNYNIKAVICGHQHWTKKIEEEGINYYLIGSLTENINSDGVPDGVYFIIELDDDMDIYEEHIKIK